MNKRQSLTILKVWNPNSKKPREETELTLHFLDRHKATVASVTMECQGYKVIDLSPGYMICRSVDDALDAADIWLK
jgi:hypothetical protein